MIYGEAKKSIHIREAYHEKLKALAKMEQRNISQQMDVILFHIFEGKSVAEIAADFNKLNEK